MVVVVGILATRPGGDGSVDGPAVGTVVDADPVEVVATTATVPTTAETTTTTRGPRGSGEAITIAIAGDSYAEGTLRSRLDGPLDAFVGPYADVFEAADVAVLNLETAVTEGGTRLAKQFTFRAPTRVLDALAAGGIDVVSLANNHGMDYGRSGLDDSIAAKRVTGMIVGIGEDEDEAYAPWIAEVKGQRIAVIGATQVLDGQYVSSWTATADQPGLASAKREERLVAEVERIRDEVDTIVVLVHWGIETHECPTAVQQDLAIALEAAGADVIVGGHQHRVAGGGMLDTAAVHYGLGNFLFKSNSAPGSRTGVFLVTVTGQEVDGFEWLPGRISNSVPVPLEGDDAAAELDRWEGQRGCTNLTGQP